MMKKLKTEKTSKMRELSVKEMKAVAGARMGGQGGDFFPLPGNGGRGRNR